MDDPIRIAVCEDNPGDAALLAGLIKQSGIPVICDVFCSAEAFLTAFFPGNLDLVFMDIYMDGLNGVEAVANIRRLDDSIVIAFTTSSPHHMLESYRLGALKYLEKPFALQAVKETIQLAALKRKTKKTVSLLIGGKTVDLVLDNILFFEMDASIHSIQIHLYAGKLRASQTLRMYDLERMLPQNQFVRCHRGYIVNLRRVKEFSGSDCVMENGAKVFVRIKDEKRIKHAYEDFLLELVRGNTN